MDSNVDSINDKQNEIDKKADFIAKSVNEEAIHDGIISPEHYLKTNVKIAWILREPHDGGTWDYKKALIERSKLKPHRQRFFDKIRYIQYSVKNNFIFWKDIPNSDENEDVHKAFLDACFININKIGGNATINRNNFNKCIELFKDVIIEQIQIAEPDILICCGTYDYVKDWFPNEYQHRLINVYHISQRTITEEEYCNDIIKKIKNKLSQ